MENTNPHTPHHTNNLTRENAPSRLKSVSSWPARTFTIKK